MTSTSAPARRAESGFAYRAPIDGLRAIAALLVVLFHADMPGMGNGYVGVDVFFVISGFLITSLLLREHAASGRISLLGFYARRARRIFPAAITVLVATAIAYAAVAPALDVLRNRMGFAYAATYVSNWYFLSQSQDYFAQETAPSPVLHYWSLSVEEQFYLAWPIALIGLLGLLGMAGWLARAQRRRLPWVLAGLTAAGIAVSAATAAADPMLSYFGTASRAYQLLAGATLAAAMLRRESHPPGREAPRPMSWLLLPIGLLALLGLGTGAGPDDPWLTGLLGCTATLVVLLGIEVAPGPAARSGLATRPARALGRWSYSIYLWHWPVIVVAAAAGLLPAAWWLRVPTVLIVTVALAALTWTAIESRVGRVRLDALRPMRAMVAAGIALTVVGATASVAILRPTGGAAAVMSQIQASSVGEDGGSVEQSATGGSRSDVLMIGDSHAGMLWPALRDYADRNGLGATAVIRNACPWIAVEVRSLRGADPMPCDADLRDPAAGLEQRLRPAVTILVSRSILVRDLIDGDRLVPPGSPEWVDRVRQGAREFLSRIAGSTDRIVIIEPIPETDVPMSECLAETDDPGQCDRPGITTDIARQVEQVYAGIADASGGRIRTVSIDDIVCPGGVCPAAVDGVATRVDTHHLTEGFAAMVFPRIAARLRDAGVPLDLGRQASNSLGSGK